MPPVEGVEPGVVESGGRVILMSALPFAVAGGGAGCCTGAGAGSVGSYSLMVVARRWKSEGGASEPRCGGSAYRPSSVGWREASSAVVHESGSVAEAREARAQARAAQRSWMSLAEAPVVEMPAAVRKAACCVLEGSAILAAVHSLTKV